VRQCSSIFLLNLDGRWESSGETATVVCVKNSIKSNVINKLKETTAREKI